jgi:hypothetical protein
MNEKVLLEYIGPSGAVMFDETDRTRPIELVAGRRYQMSDTLAAFRLEKNRHWKRPEPPKREPAAVKE